jgi:formate/nitrite transporter
MSLLCSPEVIEVLSKKGEEKLSYSFKKLFTLGILGGAYIALGYLAYVRVLGTMPAYWGSLATYIAAGIFPTGLIAITFVGGELLTGNMMVMSIAYYTKRIKLKDVLYNWFIVTVSNFIGAVLIAYFLGHYVGLTEGAFLDKTVGIAMAKINEMPMAALVSAVGCNIFVGIAVWMSAVTKDVAGKVLVIWFAITAFVVIGFQHVVANMFIIPAAIFSGVTSITWMNYFSNFIFVFLGNMIGGAVCLGLAYYYAYSENLNKDSN